MNKTKFTGFEAYLIEQGLEIVEKKYIEELTEMEKNGGRPIMTTGFVKMTVKEALGKLEKLTHK